MKENPFKTREMRDAWDEYASAKKRGVFEDSIAESKRFFWRITAPMVLVFGGVLLWGFGEAARLLDFPTYVGYLGGGCLACITLVAEYPRD